MRLSPIRRILGFVLLLLFSAPLITPLLALTSIPDSRLPACCRRNGTHHCAASMQMETSLSGVQLAPRPDRCPAYPQPSTTIAHIDLVAPTSALLFAEIISHPSLHLQTQARARVALDTSRQKRGPPTQLL